MAAHKIDGKYRESLLFQDKNKDNAQICTKIYPLIFSTPYSNDFSSVKRIIYKYLPILHKDPKLRTIMETGCKVVLKKSKTLGKILSPREFIESKSRTWLFCPGFFPCNDNRCNLCKFAVKRGDFHRSLTKK